MTRLYRILSVIEPRLEVTEITPPDPRIAAALDYLDRSFAENTKIARLAELCHLSESHFYALFSAQTGMTPVEYKNRAAIRYSERLLLDGRLSIEEISTEAGFSSASYYRRVFTQYIGMSPSEYRKLRQLM